MKYLADLGKDKELRLQEVSLSAIEVIQDNTINQLSRTTFSTMILNTLVNHEHIVFCQDTMIDRTFGSKSFQLEVDVRFAGCCDEFLKTQINNAAEQYVMVVTDIVLRSKYILLNGFSVEMDVIKSAIRKYYIDEALVSI